MAISFFKYKIIIYYNLTVSPKTPKKGLFTLLKTKSHYVVCFSKRNSRVMRLRRVEGSVQQAFIFCLADKTMLSYYQKC